MTVVGAIRPTTAPEAVARWRRARGEVCAVAFAPKSLLSLSQWSDQFRILSSDLGEPGPWRTDRVPYLRRIMDAITDPRVREVSVMKSARIGATQGCVINAIGYYVHQEPSPIIVALPTIDDAQKFSMQLLQPAIDDTPAMGERIIGGPGQGKKKRSTMLQKAFAGGSLQIIGMKSPRALRMVHGRVILMSEVDGYEGSAGKEGDPTKLLMKRAGAYGSPKFVRESTPLIKELSRIEPAFDSGSKEYYHVPCPHCGDFQRLVWGGRDVHHGIKWDRKPNGEPDWESAYYVCQPNGCVIEEQHKFAMVQRGEWRATHPERRDHLSFHLNALVSPFDMGRWSLLVKEWTEAQRKPEQLQVFVNTILGETYQVEGQQADANDLLQRVARASWWREDAPVPHGAAVLTRSVDTQGNRLETAVWAWGAGEECWLIDFQIIPGDPGTEDPWRVLEQEHLPTRYRHAGGRELTPAVTFIDAGGHHTKQVHAFTRRHVRRRVFAIFGANTEGAPLLGRPTQNNAARVVQYPVGSFTGKEALMARLAKLSTPGPGYVHLPPWLDREQVYQLTAERLEISRKGGLAKRVWTKTRDRNEMIDLWVYALAALQQRGPRTGQRLGTIAARLSAPAAPDGAAAQESAAADRDPAVLDTLDDADRRAPQNVATPPAPARKPRRERGSRWVSW